MAEEVFAMAIVQSASQKQSLSQTMAQALAVLQMPLPELYQYISSREMENPLLDVTVPEIMAVELPYAQEPENVIWEEAGLDALFPVRRGVNQHETGSEFSTYEENFYTSANQLIREVSGRRRTLLRVLESLIHHQAAFFDQGFEALEPLMPSEIADELGVSRTTVSRAVQGKYILTPMGPQEIKRLFSARSSAVGEKSAASIRERIKALIATEESSIPLSDEKLCHALQALGVTISRRTVAKYREGMGIPPAAKRKKRTTQISLEAAYHGEK